MNSYIWKEQYKTHTGNHEVVPRHSPEMGIDPSIIIKPFDGIINLFHAARP